MGNLLEHGLGWVAWQINKVIASQRAEEVKKYIEDWLKAPKIFKFSGATSNELITGSSPRFNAYGNDFGWGKTHHRAEWSWKQVRWEVNSVSWGRRRKHRFWSLLFVWDVADYGRWWRVHGGFSLITKLSFEPSLTCTCWKFNLKQQVSRWYQSIIFTFLKSLCES